MNTCILLYENLKKQKGSFLGIFLLMFIISATLSSVLSVWTNSKKYVEDETERTKYGDLVYWCMDEEETDQLCEEIEKVDNVSAVVSEETLEVKVRVGKKESKSHFYVRAYDEKTNLYKMFDGTKAQYAGETVIVKRGQVMVPVSFRSIYNSKIGDTIEVKELLTDKKYEYEITGFFEDPTEGSSLMGIKTMLMNKDDFKELRSLIKDEYEKASLQGSAYALRSMNLFRIFLENGKDESAAKLLQKDINSNTQIKKYSAFSYTRYSMVTFMLMLQNIFIGILISFVMILLIVSLVVIGHSISSTIEQNYVDFGILKAIGFTNEKLCYVQCMEYMIVIGLGLLTGLISSFVLVRLINQLIMPVSGIMIPARIPLGITIAAYSAVLIILILFIIAKIRRITSIKPIVAIRGGRDEVYFASRFLPSIEGKALNFSLALRQVLSDKRKYVGTLFVTALLVFFLTMCGKAVNWIGPNGEGIMNCMGVASVKGKTYDFAIRYEDDNDEALVESLIKEKTGIIGTYDSLQTGAAINGCDYMMTAISNPEYLHMIEGHFCKYDNEITVTSIVAKELNVGLGDEVMVSFEDKEAKFIISGINECANDAGANFAISKEGYERIGNEKDGFFINYVLADSSKKTELIKEIQDKYSGKIDIDKNEWSGIKGIIDAANALTVLLYVICFVFILIVVSLTGGKLLYREQHDLGVYKALGFKSTRLRASFAIRFGIVAFIGAIFGEIVSVFTTDKIMGLAFSLMGVSSFHTKDTCLGLLTPIIVVTGIFVVFAFLIARRIKNTDPGLLIVE